MTINVWIMNIIELEIKNNIQNGMSEETEQK